MVDTVAYLCNCLRSHQLAIGSSTGYLVRCTGCVEKCFLPGSEIHNGSPMIQSVGAKINRKLSTVWMESPIKATHLCPHGHGGRVFSLDQYWHHPQYTQMEEPSWRCGTCRFLSCRASHILPLGQLALLSLDPLSERFATCGSQPLLYAQGQVSEKERGENRTGSDGVQSQRTLTENSQPCAVPPSDFKGSLGQSGQVWVRDMSWWWSYALGWSPTPFVWP